jgi:hypothetical protein
MICSPQLRQILVSMLVLSLLAPASASAAAPADVPQHAADIALAAGGEFRGRVLDRNGRPSSDCEIRISHGRQCVACVRSGQQGEYVVTGLRGGLHSIATPDGATLCRFWAPGSAPPHAAQQLLLVSGDAALRGNCDKRYAVSGMLSNPWLLIAAGAVAIAVPVALNGNGTDRGSGS